MSSSYNQGKTRYIEITPLITQSKSLKEGLAELEKLELYWPELKNLVDS
jgi:hypothetical protein